MIIYVYICLFVCVSFLPVIPLSLVFERRFCFTSQQPRGPVKRRPPIRANTADEAIEKMLEQKRISTKINYDVLKDLNIKPGASPRHKVETPKREPRITGRGVRTAACPLGVGVSKQVTLLGKRWVEFHFGPLGWCARRTQNTEPGTMFVQKTFGK